MTTPPVYDIFSLSMQLDPRVARIITGSDKGIGPESTAPTASPGVVTGAQGGGSGSLVCPACRGAGTIPTEATKETK